VFAAAFDAESTRIATACNDSKARIWDLANVNSPPIELTDGGSAQGTYYDVAFSADGKHLAAACADGIARVWELTDKSCTRFDGHDHGVRTVAFSPDARRLATGSYDKTIMIWDLVGAHGTESKPLHTLIGFDDTVGIVRFDGSSDRVIAAGFDKTVRKFNL